MCRKVDGPILFLTINRREVYGQPPTRTRTHSWLRWRMSMRDSASRRPQPCGEACPACELPPMNVLRGSASNGHSTERSILALGERAQVGQPPRTSSRRPV